MLEIKNLHVETSGRKILKGIDLTIKPGEIHAIMGPNGSGKSTLSKVLAGHPDYQVTQGSVSFEINLRKKDLLPLSPEERARLGIFMAFQYPVEIPGLSNEVFLRTAFNGLCKHQGIGEMEEVKFREFLLQKLKILGIPESFVSRAVNVGFSGGEKKRNEILQMAILNPKLCFLDEIDSGLDVDALKVVTAGIQKIKTKDQSFVIVTHYQRILDFIKPDFVHVLIDGKLIKSGDFTLAGEIEKHGFETLVTSAEVSC